MNLLTEFDLFKKGKQLLVKGSDVGSTEQDDVLDVIHIPLEGTSLDILYKLFKRMENKKISFISHQDNKEITTIMKSLRFEYQIDENSVYFIINNDFKMQPKVEKGIKILGKRIISDSDPLGEEDWDE